DNTARRGNRPPPSRMTMSPTTPTLPGRRNRRVTAIASLGCRSVSNGTALELQIHRLCSTSSGYSHNLGERPRGNRIRRSVILQVDVEKRVHGMRCHVDLPSTVDVQHADSAHDRPQEPALE